VNLKKLSVVLTLGSAVALSGCAGPRTSMSVTKDKIDSFEDFDLSLEEENNHSVAMQYMHLISKKRVHKANDLDANMDGYMNASARTTQVMAGAGVLVSSINPFQALGTIFGQQSNLSKLHYMYRKNIIFTITAVPSLLDSEIQKSLDKNFTVMTDIVSDAYKKDGSEVVVVKGGIGDYLIPTNKEGSMNNCYYSKAIIEADKANLKGMERLNAVITKSTSGCYSSVYSYGIPYTSTGSNGFGLPSGNFMVQLAFIPVAFPIDKLSSKQSDVYLYHTSARFLKDENIKNYMKNDKFDDIAAYLEEHSALVKVPVMTNLSNGKKLQFGTVL